MCLKICVLSMLLISDAAKNGGDIAKKTMDEQGANNWLLVLTNIGTTHKTHTFTADFPRLSETRIPFWFMFQTFFFLFQGRKASQLIQPKHQVFFFSPLSSLFFFLFHVLCFRKRKKETGENVYSFHVGFSVRQRQMLRRTTGDIPLFFLSLSLLIPLCGLVSKYLPIYLLVKWEKNRPSKKMKFSVSPSPIMPFLLGPFPLSRCRYTNTLRMYPVFIYI